VTLCIRNPRNILMKNPRSIRYYSTLLAVSLLSSTAAMAQTPAASATPASPSAALDFGDFSSSAITTKAWQALEAKNYDQVAGYANKCIDMFKTQAVAQQKALTAPLTDKDQIFAQWALNDVGTCYFLLGKADEEQGKPKDAVTAYKFLADNLAFAQCWDTKGWFWKPADAAKERIKALEFDSLK